jgi:hypothetical protein
MFRSNGVFNVKNIIHEMASAWVFALTLASLETNADLFSVAYAEQALIIEHHIQAKSQPSTCVYSVSISVWDNKTIRAIPNALVEFKTPLTGTVSNTTDQDGDALISLTLEKKPQPESCIDSLLAQGYSIEAESRGYTGQGIGTVS